MSQSPRTAAIIVAAGSGQRAGSGPAKQYRMLAGQSVLARTLAPFLAMEAIDPLLVVIGADAQAEYDAAVARFAERVDRLLAPVRGGETRQDSVRKGLESLAEQGFAGTVLIHDAARPFVSPALLARAVEATMQAVAAIPALAVTDTIKRLGEDGGVAETPPRAALVSVQTPQAFRFAALLAAHRAADAAGLHGFTDDSAVMEWAGHRVTTFPGDPDNVKLTHPQDFILAEHRLTARFLTRVGTGYDVHAFAAGDHVWLGGVRIPHGQGVLAHSDGDVALHALTDALLGALADGDIGTHFPPSDERWRGASSDRFLAHAVALVARRGGVIDHLDLSIVCEAPKIGPHRQAMRARIAEIAGIGLDRVGLKATTSERLGFTGRREGLAALATATIRLPEPE